MSIVADGAVRIVVLDGHTLNPGDNPWDPVARLGKLTVHDRTPPGRIVAVARNAEIILTNKAPLTAETISQLDRLRFISVLATGYGIVDVAAARAAGVLVSNVPEYGTESVAQFVFALLLELCRQVGLHNREVRTGHWSDCPDFSFWRTPQVELNGLTMGIVGFGRIGRRVGRLAHAFGMNVLAHDVAPAEPPDYQSFAWASLEELFSAADVVSLHCPLTTENQGMVNSDLLGRMKRNAFLINTARGGLVVERDLADALNAGVIAGAAIDVVSTEPIRASNPLLRAKSCLITPHIAWATLAARRRLMQSTADNIAAYLAGKPINVVN